MLYLNKEEITMKRILCYGDSNTWGYISGTDHQRYNENQRWTKLLQKELGKKFEVIEEGLNSRTLFSDDNRPGKEGRNGFTYLKPCLDTHDKIDLIILMLGTNELKNEYNNSATDILNMVIKYINFIKNYKSQIDKSSPDILICGLPTVNEKTDYCLKGDKYKGASEKNEELNILYEKYCTENKILYLNNDDLKTGVDGVHLTENSHSKLAKKLSQLIRK